MITGQDIVFISSIEWDFLWQGHQEIASRLAASGNRVLYIENTGIRSPRLRDASRVVARLKNWIHALRTGGVRRLDENLYVCSPLVMPPFGSRVQTALNRRLLLPLIRRTARKLRMRNPLFWTYLPSDTALDLIRLMRAPESVIVYYCVGDFRQLTVKTKELRESERCMIAGSDVVFTLCTELATYCRQWNDNVHVIPSGVNLEAFPFQPQAAYIASQNGHNPNLRLVRELPHPLIGYFGGIHHHIDFGLLVEVARNRPDWSLVFVGAVQTPLPAELSTLSNVHFVGQQPHSSLADYLREFDVCIVPYINSAYTATVVPTKINEYLALGKPVVSTDLPPVTEFNLRHNVLRTSTTRPSDFLRAIEETLDTSTDVGNSLRRREVAEQADWKLRLEAMSRLIEAKLDDPRR